MSKGESGLHSKIPVSRLNFENEGRNLSKAKKCSIQDKIGLETQPQKVLIHIWKTFLDFHFFVPEIYDFFKVFLHW